MRRRIDPGTFLLITPIVWGLSFPATKLAVGHLPVSAFTAWSRGLGLLAIVAMVPLYYLAGYLHSALEPRVAAFIHWLGWFSR